MNYQFVLNELQSLCYNDVIICESDGELLLFQGLLCGTLSYTSFPPLCMLSVIQITKGVVISPPPPGVGLMHTLNSRLSGKKGQQIPLSLSQLQIKMFLPHSFLSLQFYCGMDISLTFFLPTPLILKYLHVFLHLSFLLHILFHPFFLVVLYLHR